MQTVKDNIIATYVDSIDNMSAIIIVCNDTTYTVSFKDDDSDNLVEIRKGFKTLHNATVYAKSLCNISNYN